LGLIDPWTHRHSPLRLNKFKLVSWQPQNQMASPQILN
jgi:hypothetical protein